MSDQRTGGAMNSSWQFPLIIGLSVILGGPVLSDMALLTTADLATAGVRYLAALGLSWVGVSTIFRLVNRYHDENELALRIQAYEAALAERAELAAAAAAASDEADDRAMESV